MANRYVRRYSMSLTITEMQIKSTMRYHLIPVRMAIINKSTNSKCWPGCGEMGTLVHCWWECTLVQPLEKAAWRYLKKLKMDLPFDPVIPFLGIYLKEPKTLIQKNISTLVFIATPFTIAKIWKWPKCPSVDECIKKLRYIYTTECYLDVNKGNLTFFNSMNGPGGYHAK